MDRYKIIVLGIGIICLFAWSPMNIHTGQPKIVIIGAGCAGLTTAWELHKQGFTNVHIYEARARVGGRTFSVELVDDAQNHVGYAELGGENILDGGQAQYTRALIDELELECITETASKIRDVYDDLGQNYDPQEIISSKYGFTPQTLWERLQVLKNSCISMQEVLQKLFPDDQLLQSHFGLRIRLYEGGEPALLSSDYIITLYYMLLGALCASHVEQAVIEYLIIKGGNNRLTQCIAQRLGDKVHLNCALQKIEQCDDSYRLYFASGLCVEADIVVLAIPATVYDTLDIGPEIIPSERLSAIKNIRYGQNAKIVIPVMPVDDKIQRGFWNHEMVAFNGRQGSYVVLFYPQENFIAQTLQDIVTCSLPLLQRGYQLRGLQNAIAADDSYLKQYCSCPVSHNWSRDPYARGTYSYIAAGQEKLLLATAEYKGRLFRQLFMPCNNDTLFFAGEHTTRLVDVLGTIEAAVESGVHTAHTIAHWYE